MPSARLFHRTLFPVLLAGLGYFCAATVAILLTRLNGGIALFWFANALLVALLGRYTLRRWRILIPAAAIGNMVATWLFGLAPYAVELAICNMGEAMVAALLLRRLRATRLPIGDMRALGALVLVAGLLAPALGGIGVTLLTDLGARNGMVSLWVDWLVGHGLGTLIALPLFHRVTARGLSRRVRRLRKMSVIRVTGLLAIVVSVTLASFAQSRLPLMFVPILPILLATFRLGRPGAMISVAIVAVIGGYFSAHGNGPVALVPGTDGVRLQFFQFYIAVIFAIALPVALALEQRERLMRALRESEARYRLLTEGSSDVVFGIGIDGLVNYASPSVRNVTGYSPHQLIGRRSNDLIHPDDMDDVRREHRNAIAAPDHTFTFDYRALTADGRLTWFETSTRAYRDEQGKVAGLVSVMRNVTERKAREGELMEAAHTDALTTLPNRRAFSDRLEALCARTDGRPATLVMLDIDYFKAVNDRYGHAAGDVVLKAIARQCRSCLRNDDMVARLGGEEFAILLGGADLDEAQVICERLRAEVETNSIMVDGHGPIVVTVTISLGLAPIEKGSNPKVVLADADRALYSAKGAGRNRVMLAEAA